MPLIPDDSSPVSHHTFASRSTPASAVHSRETSAARGRAPDPAALLPSLTLQPQNNSTNNNARRGQSHSKSPETSGSRAGGGVGAGAGATGAYDAGLEQRPPTSYGHHRQTSIVHGIQHSRNPSFATSSASNSPLSPELIASLGRGGGIQDQDPPAFGRLEQPDMHPYQSPGSNGTGHGLQAPIHLMEDQGGADNVANGSSANTLHRRMNSGGRTWQGRSHSRSQSRHYRTELKPVGEFALHHLFNSV